MKWRCPQCGKPHERNDPPCDNCGHHKFERAVVPQATSEDNYEQFIWVCTECGRQHQRNNPPCSRCGNHTFEKRSLDYEDVDPGETPGYLDLAGRQELGLAVVLVALVTVGVLGFTGVVTIPGITPQEPPTVEDVPGNNTTVGSISLVDVEAAIVDGLNAQRERTLERNDGLDRMATFANRWAVRGVYTDDDRELPQETLGEFDTGCTSTTYLPGAVAAAPSEGDTASTIAGAVVPQLDSGSPAATNASITSVGVDVHAGPDNRVFARLAYC